MGRRQLWLWSSVYMVTILVWKHQLENYCEAWRIYRLWFLMRSPYFRMRLHGLSQLCTTRSIDNFSMLHVSSHTIFIFCSLTPLMVMWPQAVTPPMMMWPNHCFQYVCVGGFRFDFILIRRISYLTRRHICPLGLRRTTFSTHLGYVHYHLFAFRRLTRSELYSSRRSAETIVILRLFVR